MSATCRACGIDLLWAISPNGKPCPLVPVPSDDGNVLVLVPRGLGKALGVVLTGEALKLARAKGVPLHLNHFANCPKRGEFRKQQEAASA